MARRDCSFIIQANEQTGKLQFPVEQHPHAAHWRKGMRQIQVYGNWRANDYKLVEQSQTQPKGRLEI